jgi:hypothetical protein
MKKIIRLTENDLIKLVNRVINESNNDGDEVVDYIKQKFKGLKREDGSWYIKGEEVLQYVNRFFIVGQSIFDDVKEHFNLTEREAKKFFMKYLDKKFPKINYIDLETDYFPNY